MGQGKWYLFYNLKKKTPLWGEWGKMGWEGEWTGILIFIQRETQKTTVGEGTAEENGKSFITSLSSEATPWELIGALAYSKQKQLFRGLYIWVPSEKPVVWRTTY